MTNLAISHEYGSNKMEKILIPDKLNIDANSYRFLAKLQYDIYSCTDTDIELDFSKCGFTHSAFTAYFGTLLSISKLWNKNVSISTGNNISIYNYFRCSGIYDYYQKTTGNINNNAIPFTNFTDDDDKLMQYIDNILHHAPIFLSDDCRKMLFKNIYEIFVNALEHSHSSSGVFSCGHWMPNKQQLIFSVCDAGVGIPQLVKQKFPDIDSVGAIEWALQRGNSTQQLTAGVPRGLGLADLKDFTELNTGSLIIFSNNVYYNCSEKTAKIPMRYAIAGTLITIIIIADYEHVYMLKELPV